MPIVVRARNFAQEVLEVPGPVLVDFYGEQCMPCQVLRPILMEISRDYAGLKICTFNTDRELRETDEEYQAKFAILALYQVMHLPTMLLFENGILISSIVGLHSRDELLHIFRTQKLKLTPIAREKETNDHPFEVLVEAIPAAIIEAPAAPPAAAPAIPVETLETPAAEEYTEES